MKMQQIVKILGLLATVLEAVINFFRNNKDKDNDESENSKAARH